MNKRNILLEQVEKLIRDAEMIDLEVSLYDYCRINGLNFDDASDYAKAAMENDRIRMLKTQSAVVRGSNNKDEMLHYGNPVEKAAEAPYYNVVTAKKATKASEPSEYKWTDAVKKALLLVKQKIIGRKVHNRTNKRMQSVASLKTTLYRNARHIFIREKTRRQNTMMWM
jgi:hypothetical protein